MIRRPLRFETAVGTYTWPRYALEYDATQPLVLAMVDLPGADYSFDQQGDAPALKGVGTQTVRYLLVGQPAEIEAEMDELRRICYLGARGDLVLADDAGVLRKCKARLTAMPQITLGTRDRQRAPVILTFSQLSDFMAEDVSAATVALPTAFEVVHADSPGNAVVYSGRLTVQGPFTDLVVVNHSLLVPGLAGGYAFQTNRDGLAGDWLEIDLGAHTVRFSTDAGSTWADDSANVIPQAGQVGLFAFAPGDNAISVTGAAGGALAYEVPGGWV